MTWSQRNGLLAVLVALAYSASTVQGIERITFKPVPHDGESDRCRHSCGFGFGTGPACIAPDFTCERVKGRLVFSAAELAFITDAFDVITTDWSSASTQQAHLNCVLAVTTDWSTVKPAPGSTGARIADLTVSLASFVSMIYRSCQPERF